MHHRPIKREQSMENKVPQEKLHQAVTSLDLRPIKRKLSEPEPEGKGWSVQQVEEAEKWYKRYLHLVVTYPEFTFVPNEPIDVFWHQHILDTRKYELDCKNSLGYFLHHYPYFGLEGDEQEFHEAFATTNKLYREEFGEDCIGMKFFDTRKGKGCSGQPCGNRCRGR